MRLFLAVVPPAATQALAAGVIDRLRRLDPGLRPRETSPTASGTMSG